MQTPTLTPAEQDTNTEDREERKARYRRIYARGLRVGRRLATRELLRVALRERHDADDGILEGQPGAAHAAAAWADVAERLSRELGELPTTRGTRPVPKPEHKHRAERRERERCYEGPANRYSENPMAHGGITYDEVCSCGARRAVNVNGMHYERGMWE
jgi:hypothetical protein